MILIDIDQKDINYVGFKQNKHNGNENSKVKSKIFHISINLYLKKQMNAQGVQDFLFYIHFVTNNNSPTYRWKRFYEILGIMRVYSLFFEVPIPNALWKKKPKKHAVPRLYLNILWLYHAKITDIPVRYHQCCKKFLAQMLEYQSFLQVSTIKKWILKNSSL